MRWKGLLLPFSVHVSMILIPELESWALLALWHFLASASPLPEPKETLLASSPSLSDGLGHPLRASRYVFAHPYLRFFIFCLPPATADVNGEGGSERVRVPTCWESQAPTTSAPASLLARSPAEAFLATPMFWSPWNQTEDTEFAVEIHGNEPRPDHGKPRHTWWGLDKFLGGFVPLYNRCLVPTPKCYFGSGVYWWWNTV